jgi:integral membrane protein
VFAGIPLQIWYHNLWVVEIVGTLHGYLYLVYLLVAFDFTRRLRIPLVKMLLVLLAGTVPFAAIVAERLLTRRYAHRLSASHDALSPASARQVK